MKKTIFALIVFILYPCFAFSTEEVDLRLENNERLSLKLKSACEHSAEIYNGETEDAPVILNLFSEHGQKVENSIINSVKLHLFYSQILTDTVKSGENNTFTNTFEAIEPGIRVKFNDNKDEFAFDYNIMRKIDGYDNYFSEKISLLYLSHEINKNQKVLIGQGTRLPSSFDSGVGLAAIDTVRRGQFGRTTGNVRSVGIRNIANYKYVDYDIGVYDSARYFNNFGQGGDFTGHIDIKPFGINDESKTNFKFGTGYNTGKHYTSYEIYSFYAGYDYKKFHIYSEYANADGYNSTKRSQKKADGYYLTAIYDLTPKISLIGKYDMFTPDKNTTNNYSTEYTAGITYKTLRNMKFMLNYVKRINSKGADSDIILFATRFIL